MDKIIKDNNQEIKENIVAGIVGAFLFSLAGAVVYFILHLVGYIASISGLIGAVCAVKGYSVFAKKETKKGIIIAAVASLIAIVIAWYFGLAYDVFDAYNGWFEAGDTDFTVSFLEALRIAPAFLEEPEIAQAYFGDLALSLLFCLIGCGSYVFGKLKGFGKKPAAHPQDEPAVENTEPAAEQNAPAEEAAAEESEAQSPEALEDKGEEN